MSQAEYRNTYSWLGALNLGPKLVNLSEDLPMQEQTGLVMQLHQLMVELPAMVAADLVDDTNLRFAPFYRLTAVLELIERVYPALDAGDAKKSLDELGERLTTAAFAESNAQTIEPDPSEVQFDDAKVVPDTVDPATTPIVPEIAADIHLLDPLIAPPSGQVTTIHVQPDSLQ